MSTASGYVLVTPCRDEALFARRTLDSVVAQTVQPAAWVIVDDGSSDETPAVLAEYAARHRWIQVVRRGDRGARSVGPGVIDAFYAGLAAVDIARFEFLCKLDLDLELPPDYFERLIAKMRADPRLGTCSGKPWFPGENGALVSEGCGDEMSVGMTKFYRRACFEEIGGFVREVMWDGIDCHRCRMLGWKATSFDEPALRFVHLRPMGSSQTSWWSGRVRHGRGQWFMGTGFTYMTASALHRVTHPPIVVGALGMWFGWLAGCVSRAPRFADDEFRRFLNRYQRACLVIGKTRATSACDERQRVVWKKGAS